MLVLRGGLAIEATGKSVAGLMAWGATTAWGHPDWKGGAGTKPKLGEVGVVEARDVLPGCSEARDKMGPPSLTSVGKE